MLCAGKGMTSQERAALNAPVRSSSMSSQFAAITAASSADNEDSPPRSVGGMKGKLDQIKQEAMEIKQEEEETNGHMEMGGKGGMKSEIKMEDIKQEKMDSPNASENSVKASQSVDDNMQGAAVGKPNCGEFSDWVFAGSC